MEAGTGMSTEGLKVEAEAEACCVCGLGAAELSSPEEYDAAAPPGQPPLRAVLLHLNNNKVVPNGRLCGECIRRALDAYNFSAALSASGSPPLSDKIRALRKRLHELTQKIDVFIVVGGGGGEGGAGAYSEEDIIMVERGALAAAARADAQDAARAADARGARVYQCGVCPLSFNRMSEFRAHVSGHGAESAHWCWACGARCASAAELAAHAATHAPDPLHCHLCNTTYQSSSTLRQHEASCPSLCPACPAALGSRAELRAHAAAAHSLLCADCFLLCRSAEERVAHAHAHRTDKHFVCGYRACILRFHTRSNLMAHIRKCHGGDSALAASPPATPATAPAAPRACPHCNKTFASLAALKRHARSHQPKHTDAMEVEGAGVGEAEGDRVEYLEVETLEELEQVEA